MLDMFKKLYIILNMTREHHRWEETPLEEPVLRVNRDALRDYKKRNGLTDSQLATRIGVSRSTINQIWKTSIVSGTTAAGIVFGLGGSISDWVTPAITIKKPA